MEDPIKLANQFTESPSITSSQKRSAGNCYFCYLAQKHICSLAFACLIFTITCVVQSVSTLGKFIIATQAPAFVMQSSVPIQLNGSVNGANFNLSPEVLG